MKNLKKNKKVQKGCYAFIDSQNLNLGIQKNGWKLDWSKFLQYLKSEHNVQRAYLFIGYMQENESLYEGLHDLGYSIVLKPTINLNTPADIPQKSNDTTTKKSDDVPKPAVKGNIDAELVLYAMKEMPNYEQAIIVSGDGDFYCLAEYLAAKTRLRAIMAPNRFYSTLLKPYEQYVIRLDEMKRSLAYRDFKRNASTRSKKMLKNHS